MKIAEQIRNHYIFCMTDTYTRKSIENYCKVELAKLKPSAAFRAYVEACGRNNNEVTVWGETKPIPEHRCYEAFQKGYMGFYIDWGMTDEGDEFPIGSYYITDAGFNAIFKAYKSWAI